ncbi:hypothetical protein [Alloscardovia omnicolens]|uniref:hypothetical protein n=1 Tax=Alloscardovia omnicolens TaxID=419015 RepID=UPI003A6AE9FE
MKNTTKIFIVIAIFAALAGIIYGFIVYGNQPRQYLAETYGVHIPSSIKIEDVHNEPDWDGRLTYGTLKAQKDTLDGLVNTRNFDSLSELKDSRITTLIEDVNKAFAISKVSASSKDIKYQRITVKADSMMVIFFNEQTQEYCFYATRYTNK